MDTDINIILFFSITAGAMGSIIGALFGYAFFYGRCASKTAPEPEAAELARAQGYSEGYQVAAETFVELLFERKASPRPEPTAGKEPTHSPQVTH